MENRTDQIAPEPLVVVGLGHFGRRLLWVLEQMGQEAGMENAWILCPPQADGGMGDVTPPAVPGAWQALVVADCQAENSAVHLREAARLLAMHGAIACALLAVPANQETGARWVGDYAGSVLLPYGGNAEWRQVRAQMPEMIRAWALPEGRLRLPDWRPLCRQVAASKMDVLPETGACAHAA